MKAAGVLVLLVGCGGATFESMAPRFPEQPTAPVVVAPPIDSPRLVDQTIACFTGGVWDALLGNAERCGTVVQALGADGPSLAAVRAIHPAAVEAIVEVVAPEARGLVRAVADAAREAMLARRKGADDAALSAHAALARLAALDSGSARVVTLVLAADRLETVRGLAPHQKLAAAAPTFTVLFGLARPATTSPGTWLAYVTAAANAAGHPAFDTSNTHEREQAAFVGVVAGLADRFEATTATGEARAVATAYALRLRDSVKESQQKAKARAEAKATADAAEKKALTP